METCKHNDHWHVMIWFGLCLSVVIGVLAPSKERVDGLERRIELLEHPDAGVE